MDNYNTIVDMTQVFTARQVINRTIRDAATLHNKYLAEYEETGSKRAHDSAQMWANVLMTFDPIEV